MVDASRRAGEVHYQRAFAEITPAMVVAGVRRAQATLGEDLLGLGVVELVLAVLEASLAAHPSCTGSFLEQQTRKKILTDTIRYLEGS